MSDSSDFDGESTGILSTIVHVGRLGWMNPRKAVLSLLYLGMIGFGYAIYLEYPGRLAYIHLVSAVAFIAITVWILLDLQSHLIDQHHHNEVETDIESRHFLCADPMCNRCAGYWTGLFGTAGITLTLYQEIIGLLRVYSIDPEIVTVAGFGLFVVTTPIPGALSSIYEGIFDYPTSEVDSTNGKLKFVFGLLSGLSLSITVVGVLMLLPG